MIGFHILYLIPLNIYLLLVGPLADLVVQVKPLEVAVLVGTLQIHCLL
jgi:hypothetical protein